MSVSRQPFPAVSTVETIDVHGFPNPESLFDRLVHEARQPGKTFVSFLNVNSANMCHRFARLKQVLQKADLVYCDGAGIVWASRILGNPLPTRLTAADWFLDMMRTFADERIRVFLLGGEPGVSDQAVRVISETIPRHTVVGHHHGYILKSPDLEDQVIATINDLKPDILIVGFGTPLQEYWVDRHLDRLNASVVYTLGATMDFVAGKVPRCPRWMGNLGFEWLYRFWVEPVRLFDRYIIGNPVFLARVIKQRITQQASPLTPVTETSS